MMKDIKLTDYKEEITFLFNTMCEELKEYHLTFSEVSMLFGQFVSMIYSSAVTNKTVKTINDILCGEFDFSIISIQLFLKDIRTVCPHATKYQYSYFFKYFGEKDHLRNITEKYLSLFDYPKYSYGDIMGLKESILHYPFYKEVFPDHVTERVKKDTSCAHGWCLLTSKGAEICLENAVFVWPDCQGVFRFLTKEGTWGFVVDRTFEIIIFPHDVIQLYPFSCYRARVLLSKENAVSIDYNNTIFEDYNPSRLYWGYIDMRGKLLTSEKYIFATDYENNVATISTSSLGWDWGTNYGVESPYSHNQIDPFGHFTDESQKRREVLFSELERRNNNAEFYRALSGGGLNDDEIIEAISMGNRDVFGR